ncbi:2TM domain-containing protein [Tunicatimonas pelagia]|uniref:2TM domain-containing protein n=1 Tax=Tunicatimonas pelagia TaxID=931531 RepID=UPI0026663B10|nr:2TM domain-containing protein [Tunicatimonas pelagia]WKN45650.1 2TM domain-containing protein [Tunicatimonas pelagia]
MNALIEQQIYERARRRVAFRIHLIAYVIGVLINWVVWVVYPTPHIWPIWPTLGWSIGIASHYLGVYHPGQIFSIDQEIERVVRKELNKKDQNA